jgi:acetyl esterase/lipase
VDGGKALEAGGSMQRETSSAHFLIREGAPGERPGSGEAALGVEGPLLWKSRSIRNVTIPSLVPVFPDSKASHRTAVIVCPGGGFHYLMIDKEGMEVARWLNALDIACFVLKYRVAPTPQDDEHFIQLAETVGERVREIKAYGKLALEDGMQAVRFVRRKSAELGVRSDRIGMVGFSAGAMVVAGSAMSKDVDSRPDFVGVIYGGPQRVGKVPPDAPPLFLAYANDDDVVKGAAFGLFSAWKKAGATSEMHVYSRGGHGFGMAKQGLPSDHWIEQFAAWLKSEGMVSGA